MSRPRSRSPYYRVSPRWNDGTGEGSRRFPWEDPDVEPQQVLAHLDRKTYDRSYHPSKGSEEQWYHFEEDSPSGDQRRSPTFRTGHQDRLTPEEHYRWTPPTHLDQVGCAEHKRFSPELALHRHDGRGDGDRDGGGIRNHSKGLKKSNRPPSLASSHSGHQQREPLSGRRRESSSRDWGRPRDHSPGGRSGSQGKGDGRSWGRRDAGGPYRERARDEPRQTGSPNSKRQKREMDDTMHHGYGKVEVFREHHFLPERPIDDAFGGGPEGHRGTLGDFSHREGQSSGLLIVEHDHGIVNNREPPRWEPFNIQDQGFDPESHTRQMDSSQERLRKSNYRTETREDTRAHSTQDVRRGSRYEAKRNPMRQVRPSPTSSANPDDPMNHRGRRSPASARVRTSPGPSNSTMMAPSGGPPHIQQWPQEHQGHHQEHQSQGYRSRREDRYMDHRKEGPNWVEETAPQSWKPDRPRDTERHLPKDDLDPKMPRHRERIWSSQQNSNEMIVVAEETLTIKVDMSRPVNKNSSLCYSKDRQLSLDLVNVGRQRLDFLPMLEHSGTYRESTMHTGTFAQEIITLVHQVKDQYFRGDRITLNQRFSAHQEGGVPEDEEEVEDDEDKHTLNRRFSASMNNLPDPESIFARATPLQSMRQQVARDPGDLRHDLERRRQMRLEGVKVTISGGGLLQLPLGSRSEQSAGHLDHNENDHEDEGYSVMSEGQEHGRTWGGNMGPRRGATVRQNTGPQHRNSRLGNRLGPVRRQNSRRNNTGPDW
ncbi:thyroid hormone receptor-associated protein 3 [Lampris incognitus]|uniref:thyroid hormone receptor-associated protein 3 n=1 Tax=Lampris incognitus TaxID=2546036 RepID=UPI0024B4ED5B|nr:thyroid hormone receptor-associated protein 3 [Lampris incognitus]